MRHISIADKDVECVDWGWDCDVLQCEVMVHGRVGEDYVMKE